MMERNAIVVHGRGVDIAVGNLGTSTRFVALVRGFNLDQEYACTSGGQE